MVRTLKLTVLIGLITSAASVTIDDLRNVLQTHMQKLWTLYRSFDVETRGHKHKCIYAEVRRVGTDQYRYLQHYEVANTWRSNMYVAKLLPPERRGQGPIMRISSYQKEDCQEAQPQWGCRSSLLMFRQSGLVVRAGGLYTTL
uniref:Lipocalin n=1 Tax=Rhipicephalus zambeziensis TaxID=60191 RepID=A0A224YI51_9ACAR